MENTTSNPLRWLLSAVVCTALVLAGCSSSSVKKQAWVTTWATAVQLVEPYNLPPAPGLEGNKLRQIVQVSIGGEAVQLRLSNEYGTADMEITSVELAEALSAGDSPRQDEQSVRRLTFSGSPDVVIRTGERVTSDPIRFPLTPRQNVAITIRFGRLSSADVTGHPGSRTTSYILPPTETDWAKAVPTNHWYVINAIDVVPCAPSCAIAVLGNSITDGRGSTTNQQNRWTDNLSRRLLSDPLTSNIAVLNFGLGGNCVVLEGGLGPTAQTRYRRDLFGQQGVRYLVLFEGVNDLGSCDDGLRTADDVIRVFEQITNEAHAQGIRVYGATVTPFKGHYYYSDDHEQGRQRLNAWLRTSPLLDGVIDFDRIMRSTSDTIRLNGRFLYEEDWLHPNAEGYHVMANAIDIQRLFSPSN